MYFTDIPEGTNLTPAEMDNSVLPEGEGSCMRISHEKIRIIREELLSWFKKNGRDYPWRRTKDPYKILIAEIMLQRTKADQALPVYEEFIERFPDPVSLSRADPGVVRSYFLRLGLLWRADLIIKLATELIERFEGKIPSDRKDLLSLPSIGDYIADAVLSFAYGKDVPVIDSNVCRVLRRIFGLKPRGEARRDKRFRALARLLVPPDRSREFNWAIIDFASMVCAPKRPRCGKCPLKPICLYAGEMHKHC